MLTIYGFPTSPYVRKAMLVAAEKRVNFDLAPATPQKPTEEFLAASPFKMMPAMDDDGFSLADSTAIALYLDAKHAEPPLLPADPQARGQAMLFDEFADTLLADCARAVGFNRHIGPALLGIEGNAQAANDAEERAAPLLDWLEDQAGDGWLVGDEFSLADISVAACLRTLAYGMDITTRPRTAAWLGRVQDRPAWKAVAEQEARMFAQAASNGAHKQG